MNSDICCWAVIGRIAFSADNLVVTAEACSIDQAVQTFLDCVKSIDPAGFEQARKDGEIVIETILSSSSPIQFVSHSY